MAWSRSGLFTASEALVSQEIINPSDIPREPFGHITVILKETAADSQGLMVLLESALLHEQTHTLFCTFQTRCF